MRTHLNRLSGLSGAVKFCLIALLGLQTSAVFAEERMIAPMAKKQPHTMTIHGDTRVDNYYWLRDDERKAQRSLTISPKKMPIHSKSLNQVSH